MRFPRLALARVALAACQPVAMSGPIAAPKDGPSAVAPVRTSAAAPAGSIVGAARVIDGDTLDVAGARIRLNGIDASEMRSAGGSAARAALQTAIAGRSVTCQPNGDVTYGRIVAVCFSGGADLAAMVIASGAALDCARYSGGRYRQFETPEARARLPRAGYC